MKNYAFLIMVLGFIGLVAFQEHQAKKTYRVDQSLEWWQHTLNVLEAAKTQLKQSDLPSKSVVFMTDSLFTPIQMEMTKQIQAQLSAEKLKPEVKKDSTAKPKK